MINVKKKTSTYEQVVDGSLIRYSEITKIQCCDCGLVHDIEFTPMGFMLKRNNRSTSQVRRNLPTTHPMNIKEKHE